MKLHHYATHYNRAIYKATSSDRRVSSAKSNASSSSRQTVYSKCELDSHADTIVAGANCIILNYTGQECDVSAYRDDYTPVQNVPIVTAATAWQSHETGQTYILVFHEALWMGDSMQDTLINPNQLRHFGTNVQDNPVSNYPLSIITADHEFSMEFADEWNYCWF